MEVKGTAFLARKVMLIEEIGQERYTQFLSEFAEQEPFFRQPIAATTLIPIGAFIAFNEALVSTFYGGDVQSYLQFGEKSADYALIVGPYKRIRETHSVAAFVESARVIYQGYYTAGRAEGSLEGQTAELRVVGIPSEHKHLYFEYVIVAFFRRGIELTGAHSVSMTRVLGFSNGDDEIRYRYSIEDTVLPDPRSRRRLP